ncbi:hypothetical protein ZWY2020_027180 [Hordeum vulgare]|nr:hypothetical protein ZWY2020_027180 [Hordeum vulgare]
MFPSRPLKGSKTSVTILSCPQVIPSHLQQSVSFSHEAASPPFCESPVRNWRREPLSCSVQELVRESKEMSSTRARKNEGMCNFLVCVLLEICSVCMVLW